MSAYDAVVVGSGPNGLSAAITLAQAGRKVLVREAMESPGGGMRSAELTLPGLVHDICSSVHPLAASSPVFRTFPLAEHGLEWVHPPACLAHPFDDGGVAMLERSIEATGRTLGPDAEAWRTLMEPFELHWDQLASDVLRPLRFPRHPLRMARFGMNAIRSASGLARSSFRGERARALFAGIAAHSAAPLTSSPTAAYGLTLASAGHAVGWPIARGGSQKIADALVSVLRSLGGEVATGAPVETLDELERTPTILLDLTPRQVLRIAGNRFPARYRRALERFRYGAGAFKVDWALDGPIPWKAPECARAATIHLGGTLDELTAAEAAPRAGQVAGRPFVLLIQPSLFDAARSREGMEIAGAYCHVPFASTADMTAAIEDQVERFAPGFRDRILARSVLSPAMLEHHDANLVGGDIGGGAMSLGQLFFRPAARWNPYATPVPGLYLCSASTPPGGAVHGMCGYYAARAALGERMDAPEPR